MYNFHSIEGYSKVGSYTGNSNADGTFIYTGFKPAFVMVKRTNDTRKWAINDDARNTYNVVDNTLMPNTSETENTTQIYNDFVSNGFKCRASSQTGNNSSGTYLYLAFAESPFKYANAR